MTKNSFDESLNLRRRKCLVSLIVFLSFLFCLLVVQFYKVQILEREFWKKKALAQHQISVIEPCRRGTFYSNVLLRESHPENPTAFVTDIAMAHLYVDPVSIPHHLKTQIIDKLCAITSTNEVQFLNEQFQKKSRSRKLIPWIIHQQKTEIEGWWFPFAKKNKIPRNALFFENAYKRSYPYGKMLGNILHTIREDVDPATGNQIPTGGLELFLQNYLQGKKGKKVLFRSPRHPLDFGEVVEAPVDGADVFLTINHHIQAICEEEIERAVVAANAKGGWAIMLDPHNGEILGWAEYPFFEPAHYQKYFNHEHLKNCAKIKAISDPFEPGSTMKPITIAICLKANEELKKQGKSPLFFPEEKIATSNGFFPGRSKPIKDVKLHYFLNMNMALQKSSNIYMARMIQRVVERLGESWYRQCLQDIFGFGLKTGIELPSETSALLPSPHKKHPNGKVEWSKPTPYSIAFGHNILTSSLQMLRAYALLANGGYLIQPTLIQKIVKTNRDGTKETLLDNTRKEMRQPSLLSKDSLDLLTKAMMYVTKPGGGAPKGDILGFTEAGKTATSEKVVSGTYSKKDNISTFIGFTPVKNPRFVLMIVIDEPENKFTPGIGKNQYGGNCAAPAFAKIGKRTLEYLGVQPDDPEKKHWIEESKRLQELYKEWNL